MRILNVGNFHYTREAQLFYAMCHKLTNGFIANGHNVYNFDDRLMARAGNFLRTRMIGATQANHSLLDCCLNFQPDMLVLNFADLITQDTLRQIKQALPDIRIANVFLDPIDTKDNQARVIQCRDFIDAHFITTAGAHLAHLAEQVPQVHFMPNAVDARVENKHIYARTDQPFDVFFAVGSYKSAPERVNQALELARLVPYADYSFFGFGRVLPIWGADYFTAQAACRIGLSLNRYEGGLYSSDRLAHYMGNGLLTAIDAQSGLQNIFTEDEALFFDNVEDLAAKIAFLLRHDDVRQKMAKAGHDKIHLVHNVETICRFIEERTMGRALSQHYEWPTERDEIMNPPPPPVVTSQLPSHSSTKFSEDSSLQSSAQSSMQAAAESSVDSSAESSGRSTGAL